MPVRVPFVREIFTDEERGESVADALHWIEAVGFGQALDAHPAPVGAHPVHPTIA
ncbi:hypothetical protein [Streptomyces sp. PA5.6]|uniref:hypothetical protein n=1 Tax=Streptomyces sp. PA5.6 TaxID=3035651 RepID=UPI003904E18F